MVATIGCFELSELMCLPIRNMRLKIIGQRIGVLVVCPDKQCCDPAQCKEQAKALGEEIVDVVYQMRRSYIESNDPIFGGWIGNLGPGTSDPHCDIWQDAISHALRNVNERFTSKGEACFKIKTIDATENWLITKQHHSWVEIWQRWPGPRENAGDLVIDPWPSGGQKIDDTSKVWGWDNYHRTVPTERTIRQCPRLR